MAVTAKFFGLFWKSVLNKEVDIDTDVIKAMLCTSAYVPDQDVHQYKSSVTNEVAGTGYTATGATVGSMVVSYNTVTNRLSFKGADVSWPSATLNGANAPRILVLYDSSPATDASRPLVGYVDFGADVPVTAGTLTVTWDASGIGAVTAA